MYCKNCGAKTDGNYCSNCGGAVIQVANYVGPRRLVHRSKGVSFLSYLQLFLKPIFFVLLFIDGLYTANICHGIYLADRNYHEKYSFFDLALNGHDLPGIAFETTEYSRKFNGFGNDFCAILAFFIITLFVVDIIFSLIRAVKYDNKFCGSAYLLTLPSLMLISYIIVPLLLYFGSGHIEEVIYGTYYFQDDFKIESFTGDLNLGFLFYFLLIFALIILAIDFYIVLSKKHTAKTKYIRNTYI